MEITNKLKGKVALVALAGDRKVMQKTGQVFIYGKLAREYDFTDIDGTQPVWCY